MLQEINSRIQGEFNGYDGDAVFPLDNGQIWQQRNFRYSYRYAYRPQVRIYRDPNGRYMMDVEVMNEPIEVCQVSLITEGAIVSDFTGFNAGMKFQFQNGEVWEQAEYKYCYHYAHRPHGMVIDGLAGVTLHVEGMSEAVRVRRC